MNTADKDISFLVGTSYLWPHSELIVNGSIKVIFTLTPVNVVNGHKARHVQLIFSFLT